MKFNSNNKKEYLFIIILVLFLLITNTCSFKEPKVINNENPPKKLNSKQIVSKKYEKLPEKLSNCKIVSNNTNSTCEECNEGFFEEKGKCESQCIEKENVADIISKKCAKKTEESAFSDVNSLTSCKNRCGYKEVNSFGNRGYNTCGCDSDCEKRGDCCGDYNQCFNNINSNKKIENCQYYDNNVNENGDRVCTQCKETYLFEGKCYKSCDAVKEEIKTDNKKREIVEITSNKLCVDITDCSKVEFCAECASTQGVCQKCFPGMYLFDNSCITGCPFGYHADKTSRTCVKIEDVLKTVDESSKTSLNSFYSDPFYLKPGSFSILKNIKTCNSQCGTNSESDCSCNFNCMRNGNCCRDYYKECSADLKKEQCKSCNECDSENLQCNECKQNSELNPKNKSECLCNKGYVYFDEQDTCITENNITIDSLSSSTIKLVKKIEENNNRKSNQLAIKFRQIDSFLDKNSLDLINSLKGTRTIMIIQHNANVTVSESSHNTINSNNTFNTYNSYNYNNSKSKDTEYSIPLPPENQKYTYVSNSTNSFDSNKPASVSNSTTVPLNLTYSNSSDILANNTTSEVISNEIKNATLENNNVFSKETNSSVLNKHESNTTSKAEILNNFDYNNNITNNHWQSQTQKDSISNITNLNNTFKNDFESIPAVVHKKHSKKSSKGKKGKGKSTKSNESNQTEINSTQIQETILTTDNLGNSTNAKENNSSNSDNIEKSNNKAKEKAESLHDYYSGLQDSNKKAKKNTKFDLNTEETDENNEYLFMSFLQKKEKKRIKKTKSRLFQNAANSDNKNSEDSDNCADDILCAKCDAKTKKCSECKANAKLFDGFCDCSNGFYYLESEEKCSSCDWKCSTCSDNKSCVECNKEKGLIKGANGSCVCQDSGTEISELNKRCEKPKEEEYVLDVKCDKEFFYINTITKECLDANYKDNILRYSQVVFNYGTTYSPDLDSDNEDFLNQKIPENKQGTITNIGYAENTMLFNYIQQKYVQFANLIDVKSINSNSQVLIYSDNQENCVKTSTQFSNYLEKGFLSKEVKNIIMKNSVDETQTKAKEKRAKKEERFTRIPKGVEPSIFNKNNLEKSKSLILNNKPIKNSVPNSSSNSNLSTTIKSNRHINNSEYNTSNTLVKHKNKEQISKNLSSVVSKYKLKNSNNGVNNPFDKIKELSDILAYSSSDELKKMIGNSNLESKVIQAKNLNYQNPIIVESDFNDYLKNDMLSAFEYLLVCKKTLNSVVHNHELYRKEISILAEKIYLYFENFLDVKDDFKYDIQAVTSLIETYFSNLNNNVKVDKYDLTKIKKDFENFYSLLIEKVYIKSDKNKIYKLMTSKSYTNMIKNIQNTYLEDINLLTSVGVDFVDFYKKELTNSNNSSKSTKTSVAEDTPEKSKQNKYDENKKRKNTIDISTLLEKFNPLDKFSEKSKNSNQAKLVVDFVIRERFYAHLFSIKRLISMKSKHKDLLIQDSDKEKEFVYPTEASLLQYDVYLNLSEAELKKSLDDIVSFEILDGEKEIESIVKSHVTKLLNINRYRLKLYFNQELVLEEPLEYFINDVKSKVEEGKDFSKVCENEVFNTRIIGIIIFAVLILIEIVGLVYLCVK